MANQEKVQAELVKLRPKTRELVSGFFKDDRGEKFVLSDGQCDIFGVIFFKELLQKYGFNRAQIICPTQYGKSNTVSESIGLRMFAKKDRWGIVTGSQPKSDIIMGQTIQHIFDNSLMYNLLELDKAEPLERVKRERSKKKVTFKGGGEVQTFTADSRNRQRVKEALMGFGSPNLVEDEAAQIKDDLQATVMRMLGGHHGGYLVKVGNPFYRNHFWRTWNDPRYFKLFIDYHQALREGRYTQEFIDEMRSEPFFDILYECKFPEENEIDMGGFRRLITDTEIQQAQGDFRHKGELRMGFDVGEGGDENVGILRSNAGAEIIHISRISDLMATTKVIIDLIKDYKLKPENVFVDDTGIGAGVVDRLHEVGLAVIGIKWAEKSESEKYTNLKAENCWAVREGIKNGLKLKPHPAWREIENIKYCEDTSGKLKIKSKEEMRKEGIKSPNVFDALALSFNQSRMPSIINI